jgi:hypothetical protein
MGNLISRLKMVSITGCILSIIVLPTLVYMKNGDLPSMKQSALGGFALVGAIGSTSALHFVFGPYILDIHTIVNVQHDDNDNKYKNDDVDDSQGDPSSPDNDGTSSLSSSSMSKAMSMDTKSLSPLLLQVTTRSVFGWKDTYTFNPYTDITPYTGVRPFANFAIGGGTIPLYVHPEKLDDHIRELLIYSTTTNNTDALGGIEVKDNPTDPTDVLSKNIRNPNNTTTDNKKNQQQQKIQQRNEGVKDDDFF